MKFRIERGKHIAANCCYVSFVLNNTDIMTCITAAPLKIKAISDGKYAGKVFGVLIKMEVIDSKNEDNKGYVRTLSDVRLPFSLGRTYAIGNQSYHALDDHTTSLEFKLDFEVTGLMSAYARLKKTAVNNYIDKVCADVETASLFIQNQNDLSSELLDENQKQRIQHFRKKLGQTHDSRGSSGLNTLVASVNISVVNNTARVNADALLPDNRLMNARNEICQKPQRYSDIQNHAGLLARINNPAFALRGTANNEESSVEFRQSAFEFGHKLYKEYFSGNISEIMPILSHYGNRAMLRLNLDQQVESLPWEALNDGKDFLAIKLRLARSLGAYGQQTDSLQKSIDLAEFGILLVGANSRGDLPGSITETRTIGDILSSSGCRNVVVLSGAQATRHNIIEKINSDGFNILHFSGHSVFNSDYPYQSYLELEQGSRIFLHELDYISGHGNNKKTFDIVFLNCCQSGRVGIDTFSGKSLSMCRALRESGVKNVIGMLWNVADEAAIEVASVFYTLLAGGQYCDVSEAMRQTRCKVAIDRAWQDGSWLAPVLYT